MRDFTFCWTVGALSWCLVVCCFVQMYAGDNSKINSIDMGNELMDSMMIFFASEYGTRAYWSHPVMQRDFLSGGGPQYNINNSFLLWWMLGGRV